MVREDSGMISNDSGRLSVGGGTSSRRVNVEGAQVREGNGGTCWRG